MNTTKKTNEDKVTVAIDLLKEAAVNFVKENPNSNTSNVGAFLFPRWFDEKGYVVMTILARLKDEGVLQSTGGGRGSPRLWTAVESMKESMEINKKVKPFMDAVEYNDLAEVKRLIKDVNVNMHAGSGRTFLMSAGSRGHAGIAKVLLAAGADVNIADNSGATALMYAAIVGEVELVRMFLDAGADVNAKNNDRETALDLATPEVAKILSDKGAK